jgi:hypothetical protein
MIKINSLRAAAAARSRRPHNCIVGLTHARALHVFRHHVTDLWRRMLRRRSQKTRIAWARMTELADFWLPKPIILHPWPSERFAVTNPRWEPYAGKPHVRICAGACDETHVPTATEWRELITVMGGCGARDHASIISQKGSPERNEVAAPGRQDRRRPGLVNSGCHHGCKS